MILVKKMNFFHHFCLSKKKNRETVFAGVLEAFQEY